MDVELPVLIERQPDYTTCGPTALHAIYRYYGDPIDLATVIRETRKLPGGGTLAIHLAVHALQRGYDVTGWACSVRHVDPTWFVRPDGDDRASTALAVAVPDLPARLRARALARGLLDDPRYGPALEGIEQFTELGGRYVWGDLSPELISSVLARGTPLLAGTNGTYLYQCSRETAEGPDDIRGEAFGHFIVLCGYRESDRTVAIADPLKDNPLHDSKYYRATVHRLIGAIFLGVLSDDGNLLLIRPREPAAAPAGAPS